MIEAGPASPHVPLARSKPRGDVVLVQSLRVTLVVDYAGASAKNFQSQVHCLSRGRFCDQRILCGVVHDRDGVALSGRGLLC